MDVGCRVQGVGFIKSSKQQFDTIERCTTLTALTTLNIKEIGGEMSRESKNAGCRQSRDRRALGVGLPDWDKSTKQQSETTRRCTTIVALHHVEFEENRGGRSPRR